MKMMLDYSIWLDSQVKKHYGVNLFHDRDFTGFVERITPRVTSVKPPKGDVVILEVDGKVAGTGRFDTIEEGIGEVHNVWIAPEYRGKGYASRLMSEIEEKAREYGFKSLRLDTAKFNVAAQRLYSKLGYTQIERYREITRNENINIQLYYEEKLYMEKKL